MPYTSLDEVNPAIRGIEPPVTLEQANKIAAMADSIGDDGGWAIAISAFKKGHVVETDKKCWIEKKKEMTCPECGTDIDYMATKCPGCDAEIVQEDEEKEMKNPIPRGFWTQRKSRSKGSDEASSLDDQDNVESYRTKLQPQDFLVVEDSKKRSTWHLPITKVPEGEPDRAMCGAAWAALHEGFRGNTYAGPKKQEAIDKLIAIYKKMEWELPSTKEFAYGIKAFGDDKLILWSTNAFQDDEGEIFATKALENYVARKDNGAGSRGRVWFWHVPGTDFADIKWQGVVGRYLVEVAQFDKTPYAAAMKEALEHPEKYKDLLPNGWGLSQGYLYRASDKENGVYSFLEKYETSVLPLHRASNKLTMLQGVKAMTVSQEKKDALASLIGDVLADEVLQGTSEASDMLEKLGAAFKEQEEKGMKKGKPVEEEELELEEEEMDEEEELEEEEAEEEMPRKKKKEAASDDYEEYFEEDEKEFEEEEWEMELDSDAIDAIASQVPVEQAVKEAFGTKDFQLALRKVVAQELKGALPNLLQAMLGTKEEIAKEALTGRITLKPYSPSQAADNVVDLGEKAKKTEPETPDIVASVVSNMLRGQ